MSEDVEIVEKNVGGRPTGITPMMEVFIENLCRGYPQGEAAKLAGYANYDQQAYVLMRKPHVLQAISQNITQKITTHAPIAFNAIMKLIQDDKTPHNTRLSACKYVIDKMVELEIMNKSNGLGDKDMEEMTQEELRQFISNSKRVILREVIAETPNDIKALAESNNDTQ